jgi:hypothetical protein
VKQKITSYTEKRAAHSTDQPHDARQLPDTDVMWSNAGNDRSEANDVKGVGTYRSCVPILPEDGLRARLVL